MPTASIGFVPPLPQSMRDLIKGNLNTHPGLALDKYAASWCDALDVRHLSESVQKPTVDEVVRLSTTPPGFDWSSLLARRRAMLDRLQACVFSARTVGPFTLHLSRASALENAGICLHPLYGFVYLPGSGLKGMARAFAETVWLAAKPESEHAAAESQLQRVFGFTSTAEREPTAAAGNVVFHEAWPKKWPRLQGDIVNCHHPNYYGAELRKAEEHPPGDWESPIPVAFLAVGPGESFEFALSKRRWDTPDGDLAVATECLIGALEHLGAGAKTAAGYGVFQADSAPAILAAQQQAAAVWSDECRPGHQRAEQTYTLELVTPAFLAGLHPDELERHPHECTLRSATLRGQLRWWWRTLHAAWMNVSTLKSLEAKVWGDTKAGGAVRVTVKPVGEIHPAPFDRWQIVQANHLPPPPGRKTTQGLTYHSYGMDEQRGRRVFAPVGSRWQITITARRSAKDRQGPTADALLAQAEAALWLLVEFGGVGAKSRKGFGSLKFADNPPSLSLEACETRAAEFRQATKSSTRSQPWQAASPAIEHLLTVEDTATPWLNYWMVLDRVGDAAQRFAQEFKHNVAKKALGLPHNVRPPYSGSFRAGPHVAQTDRHTSPIHYHIRRELDGKHTTRMIAFPSAELPQFETSREFLDAAMLKIRQHLQQFTVELADQGQREAARPPRVAPAPAAPEKAVLPKPKDRVPATLLESKTSKGGWKARHEPTKLEGPIQNSPDVPTTAQPGETVTLIVAICNGTQIAFRYPTAADEAPAGGKRKGK